MIPTVPWPELLQSIQRIVHAGSEGLWVPTSAETDFEPLAIRCYPTSNFVFATIVARQCDLAKFLACPGLLQIASPDDETVLLNFCPTASTSLTDAISHMRPPNPYNRHQAFSVGQGSEPVLIFGRILAVELLVPSHAIDVMASSRNGLMVCPDLMTVSLN